MVHRRDLNGEAIVLGNQGALWGQAMTWWDHETGSIWSQPLGEAILGPLTGSTLTLLPSALTTWEAWQTAHPNTLALDAPGWATAFDLKDMAIVVDLGTESAAYDVPALRREGVVNDVIAGVEIAVAIDPRDPERWAVFSRRLDSTVVQLEIVDDGLVDAASGAVFDPFTGAGSDGESLDKLAAFTSFPRDYFTFFPDGRLWPLDD